MSLRDEMNKPKRKLKLDASRVKLTSSVPSDLFRVIGQSVLTFGSNVVNFFRSTPPGVRPVFGIAIGVGLVVTAVQLFNAREAGEWQYSSAHHIATSYPQLTSLFEEVFEDDFLSVDEYHQLYDAKEDIEDAIKDEEDRIQFETTRNEIREALGLPRK